MWLEAHPRSGQEAMGGRETGPAVAPSRGVHGSKNLDFGGPGFESPHYLVTLHKLSLCDLICKLGAITQMERIELDNICKVLNLANQLHNKNSNSTSNSLKERLCSSIPSCPSSRLFPPGLIPPLPSLFSPNSSSVRTQVALCPSTSSGVSVPTSPSLFDFNLYQTGSPFGCRLEGFIAVPSSLYPAWL